MAIPNAIQTNHHVGNVVEDIAMSIRAEDFPHLADLLNGLYSNPIAAVEREYATNAWDSHVSAGITRPIEITLPTAENLTFTVQDFGLGLSIDDLRNVYSMYGRSLKRESNDVAGQLGLGCKSALSYAEAFTITAVKDHEKVVAMSTKDEKGVGVIKILTPPCATDEPNGVKITIPVDRSDVHNFIEEANNLFQFWEPGTVLINGVSPEIPEWRSTALMLDDDTFLVRKDAGLYRSHVIMGNVAYPVPDADLGKGVSHRFVARLNIGDVDFVPSREEVKYTAHTKETLFHLKEFVNATYKRAIAQQLAAASSPWEESMLKTLWMDRNLRFSTDANNPMWAFDPNGWSHRKAKSHFRYSLSHLAQTSLVVVTGFPMKSLSSVARERLLSFVPGKPNFLILPKGLSNVGNLEGRPNTYTWDEIVGATNAPASTKVKVKRPKVETLYAIVGSVPMTAANLAEVTGKVLYLYPNESARYGAMGATVVSLYSTAQLARIKRYVPNIEHYETEVAHQRDAASKAVTDHDRKIVTARTLPAQFLTLNPDALNDTDLADAIRLAKTDDTATMANARKFGIEIKATADLSKTYYNRYTLFNSGGYYGNSFNRPEHKSDVLLYLNAKYDSIIAAEAEQVAS